jgi:lipase
VKDDLVNLSTDPVAGKVGDLSVLSWGTDGPPVLALHGLTSTARVWSHLARALPDHRVVAPDLRGRGGSTGLGGPTGLAHHAADVRRVVEQLDLRDVVVVGHSMGAFLAPLVAAEIRGRARGLVLVDGGVPPELPVFFRPALVRGLFQWELRPLRRVWPDVESLMRSVIPKALDGRPELVELVREQLRHDLDGEPPTLRARVDVERAVADALDTFFGHDPLDLLSRVGLPTTLLAATHGKHGRAKAFLSDAVLGRTTEAVPGITVERVSANHLTVMFEPAVTAAVVALVGER